MASSLCYYDSPVHCRRERWQDGEMTNWVTWEGLEELHHASALVGLGVAPGWLRPWKDGQIHGDAEAMQEPVSA